MHSTQAQCQNTNNVVTSLQRLNAGIEQAVMVLKLNDLQATSKVIDETIVVARSAGIHADAMVEAAHRENLAILQATVTVVKQIENLAQGNVRWVDVASTNECLKALTYPQSSDGKLRKRFDYLPCFVQSKAFYDACQRVVDTIADEGKLLNMDTPYTSVN